MKLFAAIGREENLVLGDEQSEQKFLDIISASIIRHKDNPALVHGLRTEDMFQYVAASLGECLLIKAEDTGVPLADTEDVQPPDYMVVLKDKSRLLVEVKNCNKRDPPCVFTLRKHYLDKLLRYADLAGAELKIAIYWSRWNLWTLVSPLRLKLSQGKYSISMVDMIPRNEMIRLGDFSIGTRPPLVLRVMPDKKKPCTPTQDGQLQFTIGGIELLCGNDVLTDATEKDYAFYLMLYGNWQSAAPVANMQNGQLSSIDYIVEPAQRTKGQDFEMLGPLSSMISMRYREFTAIFDATSKIGVDLQPDSLGLNIPKEYRGEHLPLWRFYVRPATAQ